MDNSLVVQLGMNIQSLEQGLNKADHLMEGFKEQISEIGKGFIAAFAIEKIAEFGFEVSELAAKAHGVKNAFAELPQSTALMQQLKETTHETVGDLELMGFAIHAQNLHIPLKDLGELLEFTHIRALATNQDFNTLANTLITAIGRGGTGAKRAMAELQISTEDYTKALKENGNVTDAVLSLAREAIEKNKGKMDETLHSIEQNSAAWENMKIKIGEVLNSSGLLAASLRFITTLLNSFGKDDNLDEQAKHIQEVYDKIRGASNPFEALGIQKSQKQIIEDMWEAQQLAEKYGLTIDANGKVFAKFAKEADEKNESEKEAIKNIAFYENEIKNLREKESEAIGSELSGLQQKIELDQKELDLLKQQYSLERDRAQTAAINKHLNDYQGPEKSLLIKTGLPPSEEIEKSTTAIEGAKRALDSLVSNAPKYQQGFNMIFDTEKIKQFNAILNQGMQNMISTLAEGLGEMAVGAESQQQVLVALLGGIAGILRQLGELAISAGITAIALDELIENPYTAIAAGVALIALAGAVQGSAKNIMKSHGSGGGSGYAMPSSGSSNYSRGGSGSSPMTVNGAIQIKGQDLWIILSNYQTNNKFTKIG